MEKTKFAVKKNFKKEVMKELNKDSEVQIYINQEKVMMDGRWDSILTATSCLLATIKRRFGNFAIEVLLDTFNEVTKEDEEE